MRISVLPVLFLTVGAAAAHAQGSFTFRVGTPDVRFWHLADTPMH